MCWKPFSTAPKNGDFYIATDGKEQWIENKPRGCARGYWTKNGRRWYGSINRNSYIQPTYWSPLLPLPVVES